VIDAAVDGGNSQLGFDGGSFASALDVLDELALNVTGYLDLNVRSASLRIWPHASWMHGYRRVPDDLVSAILGRWVTVPDGESTIDDVTFKLPSRNGHVPFDIETPRTAIAARLFRALVVDDLNLTRGHCTNITGVTREPLRRFAHTLGSQFESSLSLEVEAAARLADVVSFDEVTWDSHHDIDIRILLPEGVIMTYILAPVPPDDEAVWRARVTEALVRAA